MKNDFMLLLKSGKNALLVAVTVAFMASCQGLEKDDPKEVAGKYNDAKFDNANEQDAQFVVDAYTFGMTEIKLADTAKTYAITQEVKDLAEMILKTHKQFNGQLADIAGAKQISLPADLTNEQKKDIESMLKKKRSQFDKDYASAIVSRHKDEVKMFEKCEAGCTDPDIKGWFTATLPTLRKSLDTAMTTAEKLNGMAVIK